MTTATLPKRFFATASAGESEDGFVLLADGKPVRTPAGRPLAVPAKALAEALAEEWNALGERIDPQALPLTRLANTALDGTSIHRAAVEADLLRHAEFDLLCYRADDPESLAARQAGLWDPLLAWAADALGVALTPGTGITPVAQPADAIAAYRSAIAGLDDFALTAVHLVAALTGSLVLGFALLQGRLDASGIYEAAHVDETWQSERWGRDNEAEERLARRRQEIGDAERFARLAAEQR